MIEAEKARVAFDSALWFNLAAKTGADLLGITRLINGCMLLRESC